MNKIGTLQRFCQTNGSWAMTIPREIQCKTCAGDGRPVKVYKKRIYFSIIFIHFCLV
jgi:hypothetical protein